MNIAAPLLLIGHATHGKDTASKLLRPYGYTPESSSAFATRIVMMPAFEAIGEPYATPEECYADRVNHRAFWFEKIVQYNSEGGWNRLARAMFSAGYDVYNGMRGRREFEASRALFHKVIWVDASKRLPSESLDSNELTAADADYVLDNNQTLRGLKLRVHELVTLLADFKVYHP